MQSTNLSLYFNENKIQNITYNIKPSSTTIPIENVKERDRHLKGFLWKESEKPKNKSDIFSE